MRGLGPLIQLKDALKKDATVADYIMALYNFLEEIHLTEHLQEIVDELMDTDRDQLAMEYSQVSSVLNTAMEQMYGSIGHLEKSQGDFVKLFKLLCKAYKIATVPVSVDQIEVFSIGDARYTDSKLRYIAVPRVHSGELAPVSRRNPRSARVSNLAPRHVGRPGVPQSLRH